ncbi:MAG: glycosyl hydrolase [Fibrobacteres bacterium]|nr:glycosyl hydrolase [Fibrobacterota bacterium]
MSKRIQIPSGTALGILGISLALLGALPTGTQAAKFKVLDFWGVGGYAHTSRTTANTYLDTLGKTMDFELTKTEDVKAFTTENLAQYKVVVLNNSTELGKILDTTQRSALMAFMKVKGVIAWHASGDVKGTWPEYTTYLGSELSSHGAGIATVRRDPAGAGHPAAGSLDTGRFDEEWYAYKTNPRLAPNVTVLYTLDESSCNNCTPAMGDHPIVWVRDTPTGGRLFYSGMGHMDAIFQKVALTRALYKQAMDWTAGTTAPIRQTVLSRKSAEDMTIRTFGSRLEVDLTGGGDHFLGIGTLDGRVIAERSGHGPMHYAFPDLDPAAVYTLTATTQGGHSVRLVR